MRILFVCMGSTPNVRRRSKGRSLVSWAWARSKDSADTRGIRGTARRRGRRAWRRARPDRRRISDIDYFSRDARRATREDLGERPDVTIALAQRVLESELAPTGKTLGPLRLLLGAVACVRPLGVRPSGWRFSLQSSLAPTLWLGRDVPQIMWLQVPAPKLHGFPQARHRWRPPRCRR